ncbi:DUF4124 domain-containing protein [Luteimonas sp. SX5]|uniref:DUF4124 domain-containing protein n=1 Tax=Luteimonas galliterrae TaxID=2940486 RepID=A0ABT0MFK9_9GAMM|nr:DUF4124 domain-containing protein [Luteimonas galliterrae]
MRTPHRFAPAALLFAAALVCTATQAQTTYRWKDASGNVHYTDKPPPTSAKEARTVTPADPAAPRDLTKIPRVDPPKPAIATQQPPAVGQPPQPAVGDIQKQLEQNREYLRKQRNPKTQEERAKRDAEQCAVWRRSLERVEAAEKQDGPKRPTAAERKDLEQTKAELQRNVAALCR